MKTHLTFDDDQVISVPSTSMTARITDKMLRYRPGRVSQDEIVSDFTIVVPTENVTEIESKISNIELITVSFEDDNSNILSYATYHGLTIEKESYTNSETVLRFHLM